MMVTFSEIHKHKFNVAVCTTYHLIGMYNWVIDISMHFLSRMIVSGHCHVRM